MRLSAATPAQIEELMAERRANLPASDWKSTAVSVADSLDPIVDQSLFAGEDLAVLIRYMADSGDYTVDDLAYAVEKPWKYESVLAEAKADLTGRV
jgi:hypothetical protein